MTYFADVKRWSNEATSGFTSSSQFIEIYEQVLQALWLLSKKTLSPVIIAAVMERSLLSATDVHQNLSFLSVDENGVKFELYTKKFSNSPRQEIEESFIFLFTLFITVMASISGDFLAPILLKELSQVKYRPKFTSISHNMETK